jgi:hypothetical protein
LEVEMMKWHGRGSFTIEAALVSGVFILFVFGSAFSFMSSVYESGSESIVNKADFKLMYYDGARRSHSMKSFSDRMKSSEGLLSSKGESVRGMKGKSSRNVIKEFKFGPSLLKNQLVRDSISMVREKAGGVDGGR